MTTDHTELRAAVDRAQTIPLPLRSIRIEVMMLDLAELLAAYDALKAGGTVKRGKKEYPAEFSAAYDAMHDAGARWREGSTPAAAFKQWQARIKAGADAEQILIGTQRYAAYVKATGSEVKMAQTFFGPGEHYTAEWAVQRAIAPRRQMPDRRQQLLNMQDEANAEALRMLGVQTADDGRTVDA